MRRRAIAILAVLILSVLGVVVPVSTASADTACSGPSDSFDNRGAVGDAGTRDPMQVGRYDGYQDYVYKSSTLNNDSLATVRVHTGWDVVIKHGTEYFRFHNDNSYYNLPYKTCSGFQAWAGWEVRNGQDITRVAEFSGKTITNL
jgi:hypothetical protein